MLDNKKELMLSDVIRNSLRLTRYLFTKWIIIFTSAIVFAILGFLYALYSQPDYKASINFILSNTSDAGNFSSLASQFGLNLNTNSDDFFSGDNIMSLMSSRPMVQNALIKTPPGKKQSLLNMICIDEKLYADWVKKERTKNAFPFPDDTSKMTLVQDSLFREVYDAIQKQYVSVTKPDKNLSIYNVTTTSHSEIFSFYLTKYIVDVTSSFYISTRTKVSQSNLSMLQHEADSLRRLLGSAITSAGAETDETFNLNPAYQIKRSSSQQSQAQVTVVGTAYGEIVKNLELAKIDLQKQTPLYQIIDEPILPLKQEKKSKLIYLILGGLFGGFIVIAALALRRFLNPFIKSVST